MQLQLQSVKRERFFVSGFTASVLFAMLVLGCGGDAPRDRLAVTGGVAGSIPSGGTGGSGMQPTAGVMPMTAGVGDTGGAGTDMPAGEGGTGVIPMTDRIFDAGSAPDRNEVQVGQVCMRLSQIQCAGEAFCCDAPGRDRATCEDVMQQGCIDEAHLDEVSRNPIAAFDRNAAARVFAELERLASTCDLGIASFGGSSTGLMSMFSGTVAPGTSCQPKSPPPLSIPIPMPPAEVAAAHLLSCTGIATVACRPTAPLSWTCDPRGGVGEQCFTDLNCFDGLFCPNQEIGFDATCTERKQVSSACEQANECSSLYCIDGVCAAATQQVAYCLAAQ